MKSENILLVFDCWIRLSEFETYDSNYVTGASFLCDVSRSAQ